MTPRRPLRERMRPTLSVLKRHPAVKWIGSVTTLVIAGLLVVLLQPDSHPPAPSATAHVTATAAFIADRYSEAEVGFRALLPRTAAISPAMHSTHDCTRLHALIASAGGADADGTAVRLFLQNGTTAPVVDNEVRAQIVRRAQAPLSTTVVCSAGAGALEALPGLIDLDAASPVVQGIKKAANNPYDVTPAGPYFRRHIVNLSPGESFALDIQARTGSCDCEWELVADLIVNGHHTSVIAKNGSLPFRTAFYQPGGSTACWNVNFQLDPPKLESVDCQSIGG